MAGRKKEKNKGGRPTKKTPDIVDKLIEAFHDDSTIEIACINAGIDKTTYHKRIREDEEFSHQMAMAQEYPILVARRTLVKAAEGGDVKASVELAKRRDKRYSDKQEISGVDGKDLFSSIAIVDTSKDKSEDDE